MSKESLAKLPYELTEVILSILFHSNPNEPRSTFLSLSLASHSFNQIVQPHLYRNVSIHSQTASDLFFSTLESNPKLCTHLRALYHEPTLTQSRLQDSMGIIFPTTLLKTAPRLQELAWISSTSMGGFIIGHHMSTSLAIENIDKEAEDVSSERQYRFYHIITPVLDDWIHRRISKMDLLSHLVITIFPGMVLDDDKMEHVMKKLIKSSNLSCITLEVGHSSVDFGSRLRRIDKSKSISKAIERISSRTNKMGQDVDIIVRTCQHGFRNGNLEEDVKFLLRAGWEEKIRKRSGVL